MNTAHVTMRQFMLLSALAIVLGAALGSPSASAQDEPEPEVVSLSTTTSNGQNGLQLQTYFLVRDKKTGRIIPPNKIESATLQLSSDGERVTALIENPTTPIKIALLLDESGSMKPYVAGVRAAAKDAIDKAPDQAQFAIFRFSEVSSEGEVNPDLPFTAKSDSATINSFIDQQYDSRPNGSTCLYNITLQATRYLASNTKPGERRAIILFTDGTDERLGGGPCSDRSLDDVTREAGPESDKATPIYAVGLCGNADCANIDATVLERMANQTKAIWRKGTPDQLTGLFYDVMDDLKGQRLAQATITPCQEQQVTLLVKLVDVNEPVGGIVPFTNERCYTPQAVAEVSERQANAAQSSFDFPATIQNSSPLELSTLQVQVVLSNDTVYTQTLKGPTYTVPPGESRKLTLSIPSRYMQVLGEYGIRLTGTAADGTAFVNKTSDGDQTDVLGETVYKQTVATDVQIAIKSVRPNDTNTSVTATIDIANKNVIDPANLRFLQYEGRIIEADNNEVQSILPTGIDLTNTDTSFTIEIPLDEKIRTAVEKKTYKLSLTLLAPADSRTGKPPQQYESTSQGTFVIVPPPARGWWDQLVEVLSNPFVLVSLAAIVLAGIGFYAYSRYQSRRVIPLPYNSGTVVRQPVNAPPLTPKASTANAMPKAPAPAPVQAEAKPPRAVQPPQSVKAVVPANAATQIHAPPTSQATVLHSNATELAVSPRKPRVRVGIVQTVDAGQCRDETLTLPCVIGRENAQIVITGDAKISRTHLEIISENGEVLLIDRGSANGSFIDDTRLTSDEPVALTGLTRVRLGPNTIIEVEPKG